MSFVPSVPASGEVLMPMVMDRLGSSTVMTGSGRGSSGSASVSPMVISAMPATAAISPGPASVGVDPVEGVGHVELGDLGPLDGAVELAPGHRGPLAEGAVVDPADGQAAEIGGGVEVGHDGLQGRVRVEVGGGDAVDDGLEQGLEVGALHPLLGGGPAGPGVGVEDGEVDLVLVGVEVEEQLLDLVDHLVDAGVGPVDLVDHQHHRQAGLEGLAQHEPGLGERALGGVDQEEDAVDHGQAPLDLAAEVGVAGGVDDVDLDPAVERRRCSWPGW